MVSLQDILFPNVILENWQMMPWERLALTGVLARQKPKVTLEVGVYYGGSLSLTSQFAEKIYAIDIDPAVRSRFQPAAGVELIIGDSTVEIPRLLSSLSERGEPLEFVLIDADHSEEGVRRDINLVLQYKPLKPLIIMMHDSGNPSCRRGIKSADWTRNPHVVYLDLDYVPGQIIEHTVPSGQPEIWGGFAIAYLSPEPRNGPLTIAEGAKTSIAAIHDYVASVRLGSAVLQR